jgi:hypothetical protein
MNCLRFNETPPADEHTIPHHATPVCYGKGMSGRLARSKHYPTADPSPTKTKMRTRDSALMISGAWKNPRMLNLVNMVYLRIG